MVHTVSTIYQMNSAVFDDQSSNFKMNPLKRNLTLDLENSKSRRNRFSSTLDTPLISTPDCKKLDMSTPEIVELLKRTDALPTPTSIQTLLSNAEHINGPNDNVNTNSNNLLDTKNIDVYSFENQYPVTVPTTTSTATYDCFSPESIRIKEEPMQMVPSIGPTPPVSPINMEKQEKIKKDRKKERNREAAAKCRKKKLEKIATLEGRVKLLREENDELTGAVRKLTDQVMDLKAKVLKHHKNGCLIPSLQLMNN